MLDAARNELSLRPSWRPSSPSRPNIFTPSRPGRPSCWRAYKEALVPFSESINVSLDACWKRFIRLESRYGGAWEQTIGGRFSDDVKTCWREGCPWGVGDVGDIVGESSAVLTSFESRDKIWELGGRGGRSNDLCQDLCRGQSDEATNRSGVQ